MVCEWLLWLLLGCVAAVAWLGLAWGGERWCEVRLCMYAHLRVFGADVEGVEAVLARDVVLAEDDLENGEWWDDG